MVDYASKTVAQLQEILRSRSLPHSGKKAELIARLEESDLAASQAKEHQAAAEDGAFRPENLPAQARFLRVQFARPKFTV